MLFMGVLRDEALHYGEHRTVHNWRCINSTPPEYGHKKRGLLPGYINRCLRVRLSNKPAIGTNSATGYRDQANTADAYPIVKCNNRMLRYPI